jgi:hypothetical protein
MNVVASRFRPSEPSKELKIPIRDSDGNSAAPTAALSGLIR